MQQARPLSRLGNTFVPAQRFQDKTRNGKAIVVAHETLHTFGNKRREMCKERWTVSPQQLQSRAIKQHVILISNNQLLAQSTIPLVAGDSISAAGMQRQIRMTQHEAQQDATGLMICL